MGRAGAIYSIVLTVSVFMTGCTDPASHQGVGETVTTIMFVQQETGTRTTVDDSDQIDDISLLVFDRFGKAEENIYTTEGQHTLKLISGEPYSFYAFAGFGYQIYADDISEIDELTFSYTRLMTGKVMSLPRYAFLKDVIIKEDMDICMELGHLLAKVSLSMDRSCLDDDVSLNVTGLEICNCPAYSYIFSETDNVRPAGRRDISWPQEYVMNLNTTGTERQGEVTIYVPEETFRHEAMSADPAGEDCIHVEIHMDYLSCSHYTSYGPLIYRLHIGDSLWCSDLGRNTHHKISICPTGDGLSSEGWRIDKTNLKEFGPSRFASFPESYIQGDIGDTLHLRCEFYPPHAPFEVGLEELEYDKAEGIYDYIIDEDGHGVRLILTGPGTGIVYMEAGSPVNEAAMWVIEVNLPPGPETVTDTSPYKSPCWTSTAQEFLRRQDVLLRHRPRVRDLSPSPPHG